METEKLITINYNVHVYPDKTVTILLQCANVHTCRTDKVIDNLLSRNSRFATCISVTNI